MARSAKKRKARRGASRASEPATARAFAWRAAKIGFWCAVVLVCIPLVLTVIYRFDAVKPVSTLMVRDWVTGTDFNREWVDIEDVAPVLYQSVLMSEDGQFCRHHGIDLGELRAIVESALQGEQTRGASTITMQTAKNLFLWGGRSYVRKALELPLAIWIDFVIPKKRIMEIYLNIAEWAPGAYGIQAGARHHFGRDAANLTGRQAALMAVTLPNPYQRNPAKPTRRLRNVADVIQRRASRSGDYIGCLQ